MMKLVDVLKEIKTIEFIRDLSLEAIEEMQKKTGENYSEIIEDLENMSKEEIIDMFEKSDIKANIEIADLEEFKKKIHTADAVFDAVYNMDIDCDVVIK